VFGVSRRRFMAGLGVVLGAAMAVAVGVPIIGVLIAPLIQHKPEVWRPVGAVDQFSIGQTVAVQFEDTSPLPWSGVTARSAAWLRRVSDQKFIAFSVNCTHLGCPVRWLASANLFMCPCHGGVYYNDGTVAAGPPPKSLVRYPVRVKDGQVQIQTSPIPIT
jgi:menaquinol-cytochrome c reductase iron-sulfur subunit